MSSNPPPKRTPVSAISYPKRDVNKQNLQTESWMRANPDKVTYLKEGETLSLERKYGRAHFKI